MRHLQSPRLTALRDAAAALAVLGVAWAALLLMPPEVNLANRAVVLVLAYAIATVWLPLPVSLVLAACGTLAFNWFFVPPQYTFGVDDVQDTALLGAMFSVNAVVAWLVWHQRVAAAQARRYGARVLQLQQLGDVLRASEDRTRQAQVLQQALQDVLGTAPTLLVLRAELPSEDDATQAVVLGQPDDDEWVGLWQCLRQGHAFGPGTGRHEELAQWYLPMRGGHRSLGAALLVVDDELRRDTDAYAQAQALCDQMGQVLERTETQRLATAARDEAQLQGVRNALLTAISHDYRTPLATILGAATSLQQQGGKLTDRQRADLVDGIIRETEQLSRLTNNTLQLARLDAPGVRLTLDWESPEEIAGALAAQVRCHDPDRRLHVRLEPGLPLLRCDALLMQQLLENLVENAYKYTEPPAPVELLVRRQPGHVVFAVRDRGPGVPPAMRERIFDVFERGDAPPAHSGARTSRSAGVGLAVCRAIARAHGGELRYRPRGHGGASFECWLAEQPVPAAQPSEAGS